MTEPTSISDMLEMQNQLQINLFGGIAPADLEPEQKIEFIRWNVLALEDELHEGLAETGWKPWASSNHINTEGFHAEMVDAWHFFMNLMLATGMTEADLMIGYAAKRAKNVIRQETDYDGIEGKCRGCGRGLDDDYVACYELPVYTDNKSVGVEWFCRAKGISGKTV
jgi:hypothetical protein